jgi:hypothetical protein
MRGIANEKERRNMDKPVLRQGQRGILVVLALVLALALAACGGGGSSETGASSDGDARSDGTALSIPSDLAVGDVLPDLGGYAWRVLDVQDGKALLITEDIVDLRPYNEVTNAQRKLLLDEGEYSAGDFATTWAECSLRAWLNKDFLESLPDAMRKQVVETDVKNEDNLKTNTIGGADTQDKVFLLSIDEADEYFGSDPDRVARFEPKDAQVEEIAGRFAKSPIYAYYGSDFYDNAEKGASDIKDELNKNDGAWLWWLRSPGGGGFKAARVNESGFVQQTGIDVCFGNNGVRPALWLNLN